MALIRSIGRSILQRTTGSSPRWLSTAAESTKFVTHSPKKRLLFDKVKANPNSSIAEILNEWVDQGNFLKKFDCICLVNHLRSQKSYQSALQLYDWMEENNVRTTDSDAAIRIDLLFKSKGLASAENYFNTLQDSENTNKTYGALLSCYCRERVLDKALEFFEKMKLLNYTSSLNYNNMLALYYREQPEKAKSLFQEMEEKQITPNHFTHNLLINSYAALKDLDAVEEVESKIRSSDMKIDSFTVRNLATIYFNSGLHEKANACLEELEKMQDLRHEEVFDACRTRIKLYSEMNNLSGVNRAWETVKSAFPNPNNTAYLLMLSALSKLGELDSLEKLFNEWEAGCSDYDIRLPNVMLEFYLKKKMIEKALALYDTLLTIGARPNLRTLDVFATLCMKTGQVDSALKYMETGVDKAWGQNRNWFPTDETIKLFLNYFEERNDADRAEKFVRSMKKVNRLDSTVYDSLLLNIVETSNVGR